jgi:hypothetical protein
VLGVDEHGKYTYGERKEVMIDVEKLIDRRLTNVITKKDKILAGRKQELGLIKSEFERGKISQILKEAGDTIPENQHLSYHIDRFIEAQQRRCAEGQIKVGRLEKIKNTIKTYREWSPIVRVAAIGTKEHIDAYRTFLSDKVIAGVWKPKYANGASPTIRWYSEVPTF